MTQAIRDQNHTPVLLGLLCTDGVTPVPIAINPSDGGVKLNLTDTISQAAKENAARDENRVPTLMGVSSEDGVTPVPIYVDADGAILADE